MFDIDLSVRNSSLLNFTFQNDNDDSIAKSLS